MILELLKPNRFKVNFFLGYFLLATVVFLVGAYVPSFNTPVMNYFFAALYFPAAVFISFFSQLPMFKHCSGDICAYDQTVAVWLSVSVFIMYAYFLACLVSKILTHRKKV